MKTTINTQLEDLYRSHWVKFSSELNKIVNSDEYGVKPTNPLLLKHPDIDSFESSDIRVMIIGQETNQWEGVFYNNFDDILNVYPGFYPGYKYGYKGYFKNHFNNFLELLEQKFPDKKISCFWNNVIKVGKANDKGAPPKYILELEQKYFSVLQDEINIIKPNVVLFYSGYSYDQYIEHQIPNLVKEDIAGFDSNILQLFKIKNVDFAFRTSHPQRLHFLGKAKYQMIYEEIISKISL